MLDRLRAVFKKNDLHPIPMTMPEFEEWSARIIEGAQLPTQDLATQKFALASMILELQKVESFKSDLYFVHRLRNAAAAQCALQVVEDLQTLKRQKLEAEKKAKDEAEKSANATKQ